MLIMALAGCTPGDYSQIPSHSKRNFLQAVIEIPAGTNHRITYCRLTHRFLIEMTDDGKDILPYLPYPANFGFIPSTRFGNPLGKEGELLEIMVIAESLKTGTVIEVIPLGLLIVKDDFHTDYKVLAIPADPDKQVIRAGTYHEFNQNFPGVTAILEDWFVHSDMYHNVVVLGWEDERVTGQFINKWLVNKTNINTKKGVTL